jgi:hypothetical protein
MPFVIVAKLLRMRFMLSAALLSSGISSGVNFNSLTVALTNLGKSGLPSSAIFRS